MKITRSIFNYDQEETETEKQFEKFANNPSELLKEHRKRMKPMVDLIKVTVSTKGWLEVIQPFLEHHGNSNIIFSLFRKKADEVEKAYAAGKAEAYHNLLTLIENILKFDLPEKKEDEEKPE
jgi:hypothetical protein